MRIIGVSPAELFTGPAGRRRQVIRVTLAAGPEDPGELVRACRPGPASRSR